MQEAKFSLSIAGLDPSGGAGILSDVKTFESLGMPGFAVSSGLTYQNEHTFTGLRWNNYEEIIAQLEPLFDAYEITCVKIGLIENIDVLENVVQYLRQKNSEIQIVWDPILASSTGFQFHGENFLNLSHTILESIDLFTPNQVEIEKLFSNRSGGETGIELSRYCSVLLKGGHNQSEHSNDILYQNGNTMIIRGERIPYEKHGTGCVLSAAIVAHLSRGNSVEESCRRAKNYVTKFLTSNKTLLGSHTLQNA